MADKKTFNGSDRWVSITTSDTVDLTEIPRGIWVNGAGDVSMDDSTGTNMTFTLAAGMAHPLQPKRIRTTSTTATGIRALY